MQATDILMQEHRVIERVLDALERAVNGVERGRPVRPAFFLEAADFISGFADGRHHRKEENVLFHALLASGLPAEGGPVDVMLHEHEEGRAFTRVMRNAARQLETGGVDSTTAWRTLLSSARGYVALLRAHIEKEDEMLFPMADALISAEGQARMLADFAKVDQAEAGNQARERFLALAVSLEGEAAALAAG